MMLAAGSAALFGLNMWQLHYQDLMTAGMAAALM
jgi:hypothetical protein